MQGFIWSQIQICNACLQWRWTLQHNLSGVYSISSNKIYRLVNLIDAIYFRNSLSRLGMCLRRECGCQCPSQKTTSNHSKKTCHRDYYAAIIRMDAKVANFQAQWCNVYKALLESAQFTTNGCTSRKTKISIECFCKKPTMFPSQGASTFKDDNSFSSFMWCYRVF